MKNTVSILIALWKKSSGELVRFWQMQKICDGQATSQSLNGNGEWVRAIAN
ncbi:MAG: hypothetical protein V7L27_15195 [Nostoc sp.]|uniref:hypothetical protein n=1 Tax=Nostoc sp. TaxID=1180 RepID=UPI002FF654BA